MKMHTNQSHLILLLLFSLSLQLVSAQQMDFGFPNNSEDYWDGLRLNRRRGVSLLNTDRGNTSSLLLTRHQLLTGSVINTKNIIWPNWQLEGRAFGLKNSWWCPSRAFFVTGRFRSARLGSQSGAFILRTNSGLTPTDFFRRPAIPNVEDITEGISVETDRRASYIVGNSRYARVSETTGEGHFWITKFRGNSASIQWSYLYQLVEEYDSVLISANGSCLGEYSTPGNALQPGLAVVGTFGPRNNKQDRHTFLSMIDRASGTEIWRVSCPSSFPADWGTDVVYDPIQRVYFVVGYVLADNNHRRLYTAVVRHDGLFLGSAVHTIGPGDNFHNISARDVCLSLENDSSAVVTGYVEVVESMEPVTHAFVAKMRIHPYSTTIWSRYYYGSSANSTIGSESIKPLNGSSPDVPGYMLITGGQLGPAQFNHRDAQFIRITADGTLPRSGCKVINLELNPRGQQASSFYFKFNRQDFPWVRIRRPSDLRVRLVDSPCEQLDSYLSA